MKPILPYLVATTLLSPFAFAQKTGDAVTPDALGKIEWIQGSAPAAWEPGKTYILECWATWCGPCVAAIPHMDELHDKYHEKGLRVIGVNVWENGKDKVAAFVKTKGDGMSYPVAYTGKGGDFETDWLKPAGVRGIPHAFVVKDGKVLLTTHPGNLTEPVIEALLAGGDAETKAIERINASKTLQADFSKHMQDFHQASSNNDIAAMEKSFAKLNALDPKNPRLGTMECRLLLAKKDWAGLETAISKMEGNPLLPMTLHISGSALLDDAESPIALRKFITSRLASNLEKKPVPSYMFLLSRLQWSLGDKEAAIATAVLAAEQAKSDPRTSQNPTDHYDRFASALKKGEVPSDEQVSNWHREAVEAKRAEKQKP